MMPSCDQIGVPIHFHSSTTSGSASLMSLRILLRVSPRQSPSSAILFEMSSDADRPWLAPDFFMFSSSILEQREKLWVLEHRLWRHHPLVWIASRSSRLDPERRRVNARRAALRAGAGAGQPGTPHEGVSAGDAACRLDDEPLPSSAKRFLQMLEVLCNVLLADGDALGNLPRGRGAAKKLFADGLTHRPGPLHAGSLQSAAALSIELLASFPDPARVERDLAQRATSCTARSDVPEDQHRHHHRYQRCA